MLFSRQVALAKTEVTYNVDPTPTASANAFLISHLTIDENVKMNERVAIKKTLAPLQAVPGVYSAKISFEVEAKGSGTAGTAPEYNALLLACGLQDTITASTSCVYTPLSTASSSVTIYIYQDGSKWIITGAVGTYEISCKSGGIPTFKFTFDGHVSSHVDASLVTPTLSSVVPPAALDSAVLIAGTYTPVLSSYSFNSGCSVTMPESIAASDGYAPFIISKRDGKIALAVEMDLVGNYDYYGIFKAGTSQSFALPIGATAGNIITISHPAMYISAVKQGNAGGILTLTVDAGAVESSASADDEVSISFT